jgi:hypothetical protein
MAERLTDDKLDELVALLAAGAVGKRLTYRRDDCAA